jgi:hypothetical protein
MMNRECVPVKAEPLPGTVKLYHRHLFVCTGPVDWAERIETGGGFLQTLAKAIAPRAAEMPLQVKLTACDDPGSQSGYDLLVFPDNVRYRGVREADIPVFVEEHLVRNQAPDALAHEPLSAQYVFVCTHGRRDLRCGQCGPPLVAEFRSVLKARHLGDKVIVRGASHVGGHKYAGNVLIYPTGDWYGYVTPADVPRLIEQHIVKGEVVTDLWRGRMGLLPEEQVERGSI